MAGIGSLRGHQPVGGDLPRGVDDAEAVAARPGAVDDQRDRLDRRLAGGGVDGAVVEQDRRARAQAVQRCRGDLLRRARRVPVRGRRSGPGVTVKPIAASAAVVAALALRNGGRMTFALYGAPSAAKRAAVSAISNASTDAGMLLRLG